MYKKVMAYIVTFLANIFYFNFLYIYFCTCSAYAHSDDTGGGLVLARFSLGVLICSYKDPKVAQEVVCQVEKVCDILRA